MSEQHLGKRKRQTGRVVSDKGDKTIVIAVERLAHPNMIVTLKENLDLVGYHQLMDRIAPRRSSHRKVVGSVRILAAPFVEIGLLYAAPIDAEYEVCENELILRFALFQRLL